MLNNDKCEVYQFELGVLLDKNDKEYECYNKVWDYKYGYYNVDWGFCRKLKDAQNYITDYVKNGCKNTYGIISKVNVSKEEYDICEEDTAWVDMDYNLGNVIYSICRNQNNEIVEDFIDIKTRINENEESEEL